MDEKIERIIENIDIAGVITLITYAVAVSVNNPSFPVATSSFTIIMIFMLSFTGVTLHRYFNKSGKSEK